MNHLEAFLHYLAAEKRYSPLTVRVYGDDIRQFMRFCLQNIPEEFSEGEDRGAEAESDPAQRFDPL